MHPDNISAELKAVSAPTPRSISVMGSTGSIGTNTIDLIERNPDLFRVEALTANKNVTLLAKQAVALKAKLAVVADPGCFAALKDALAGTGIEAAAGPEGLLEAAERPSDLVMAAIVGFAGLAPTLAAIRRGATLLLANKEALVCAGELMMAAVQQSKARILPVDSEHNAIFQVFDFERKSGIEHITLTASGGPFRLFSKEQMEHVTREEALAHPNWVMGEKISVDSASMMNKGLELIEAAYLFGLPEKQIKVLIHPQSIIHSMVSYVDGSVLAQLGSPDMRTPIAYTLAWPERIKTPVAPLDLARIGQLTFEEPDPERFPALDLARVALKTHKTVVFNAANEIAVEAFLSEKINFASIARFVAGAMDRFSGLEKASLEEIIALDEEVRCWCNRSLKN